MSVHVSSWAWSQKVGNAATKLVLLKLADAANDDGICWPSQRRLADECEMTDRYIRTHVQRLGELGLLKVKQRVNEDGTRSTNVYILSSGTIVPAAPAEQTTGTIVPLNRKVEPSEPLGGTIVPVVCRHCGPLGKVKTEKQLTDHMENVHGEWKATA